MKKIRFKVLYATSQDNDFRAVQLNEHSLATKGWHSERFCKYPQEIILELEHVARIRKIQILSHQSFIASKIEFFIGLSPDKLISPNGGIQYRGIGYIELSDNEKNGYQTRELKSVHVDVVGSHLRIVAYKNHFNRLNLFSQVGIVAVNVLGVPAFEENPLLTTRNGQNKKNEKLQAYPLSFDCVSSIDDVTFDLYQDPEVARMIRQLDRKKQSVIQDENFELAKRIKLAITELSQLGTALAKCESEKITAAKIEDFDLAEMRKTQADEIRARIFGYLHNNDLIDLVKSSLPPLPPPSTSAPRQLISSQDASPRPSDMPKSTRRSPSPLPRVINNSRNSEPIRLPTARSTSPYDDINGGDLLDGNTELDEEKRQRLQKHRDRILSLLQDAFGLPLARELLSREYSERLNALKRIHYEMQHLEPTSDSAIVMLRACAALLSGTMHDVPNMVRAGLALLKFILTEFISKQRIPRSDCYNFVDSLLPILLAKTDTPVQSMRMSVKNFIVQMSQFKDVMALHVVPRQCTVPLKPSETVRQALSRTELVAMLFKVHKLTNGFTLDNMMTFASDALTHPSGEVRKQAEDLIITLYRVAGSPVRNYLPPDNKKTRKNILYRGLFEAFDSSDGKSRRANPVDNYRKPPSTALPAKPREFRTSSNVPTYRPSNPPTSRSQNPSSSNLKQPSTDRPTNPSRYEPNDDAELPPPQLGIEDPQLGNEAPDKMCIFCGQYNLSFLEDGLKLHYWRKCPVLTICPQCNKIVEVSDLTKHQLKLCARKRVVSQCRRCTEAIPHEQFQSHIMKLTCLPAVSGKNHCPLCHMNFLSGTDAWKLHLMKTCKKNPRLSPPA